LHELKPVAASALRRGGCSLSRRQASGAPHTHCRAVGGAASADARGAGHRSDRLRSGARCLTGRERRRWG
jgi:hypothetical protein